MKTFDSFSTDKIKQYFPLEYMCIELEVGDTLCATIIKLF